MFPDLAVQEYLKHLRKLELVDSRTFSGGMNMGFSRLQSVAQERNVLPDLEAYQVLKVNNEKLSIAHFAFRKGLIPLFFSIKF